jgi:molybdopterin molybdotransferase
VLTTAEATQAISAAMPAFGTATVSLAEANGRVLRQSVCAERDQPPFDRVTMDGIAIRYSGFESGDRVFSIQGRQHAGEPRQTLDDPSACIEIMTGAVLPANADCVIPVERISVNDRSATLENDYAPRKHQYIHTQGSDYKNKHKILREGHGIEAVDIAIIASCGLASLEVSAQPRIAVISTGDELVAAGQPIASHQIRSSNGPAIIAMLESHGYSSCKHDHLTDNRRELAERLAGHLQEADVLLLSGGVSMGKADFVPEVLVQLGVKVSFHKISQRPGKPMWFGIGPGGKAVFALPGNPVSTLVCCRQYVLPALARASGRRLSCIESAALSENFVFAAALTCFLPVKLNAGVDGQLLATPVPTNTSGDFAALSGTDGYLELAQGFTEFPAGSSWPLHRWGSV